jgi:hypothetical protein
MECCEYSPCCFSLSVYLSSSVERKTVGSDEGFGRSDEERSVAEIRVFPEQIFGGAASALNNPVEPGLGKMKLHLK